MPKKNLSITQGNSNPASFLVYGKLPPVLFGGRENDQE